ncbi:hypothetical protein HGRIS_010516 [Hohenbuehelia grisea]|uniref:NACHT domain-containing protein n=1 Tax=Hohenbuehelia grisea TaxID=104357 RepID=A0ABR3IX20_9AGAR
MPFHWLRGCCKRKRSKKKPPGQNVPNEPDPGFVSDSDLRSSPERRPGPGASLGGDDQQGDNSAFVFRDSEPDDGPRVSPADPAIRNENHSPAISTAASESWIRPQAPNPPGDVSVSHQPSSVPEHASSISPSTTICYNDQQQEGSGRAVAGHGFQVHTNLTVGDHAVFNQPMMNDVKGNQFIYQHDDRLTQLRHVPDADVFAQKASACMDGTRVEILKDLQEWSRNPVAPRVYWLVGPAGTGKSAISRSIARWLSGHKLLGGSFFCQRQSASHAEARAIIRTLACHLSRQHLGYHRNLLGALQDPLLADVAHWPVDQQVEELLVKLLGIDPSSSQSSQTDFVFVIDALDECENSDETSNLLRKLLSISSFIPLKWFITSRSEQHIRDEFEYALNDQQSRILRLHDIERDVVEKDIILFIRHKLEEIRRRLRTPISDDWPGDKEISKLSSLSGTLFIYAATAVQYIAGGYPVSRLKNLTGPSAVAGKPLKGGIDEMYRLILLNAFNEAEREPDEIALTKRAMTRIIVVREPLSLATIAHLLREPVDKVRASLDQVHAVIQVPLLDDGIVTTFHASFPDFLSSYERGQSLWIDFSSAHGDLAKDIMEIMTSDLKFNISGCRSSYKPHIEQEMSPMAPALVYSCLSWTYHLCNSAGDQIASLLEIAETIVQTKFLYWTEVLGVTGNGGSASSILLKLLASNLHIEPSLRAWILKANAFVLAFREVIERCAPHIYLSGLPNDTGSQLVSVYGKRFDNIPRIQLKRLARKAGPILHLHGHLEEVTSVAFSPNGTRIASGSADKTIRVWDASTGDLTMQPFEGHSAGVRAVAFSPDGTRIASGSADKTIRVWDASTGDLTMQPFEGHSARVRAVAFSPDGTRIASGSDDKTIRVWDASTGDLTMQPFEGHSDWVSAVAFSPDGTRIASGSDDKTIRVWDASTGDLTIQSSEGHPNLPEDARHTSGFQNTFSRAVEGYEALSPSPAHPSLPQAVSPQVCYRCQSAGSAGTICPFNHNGTLEVYPDPDDGWCKGPKGELLFWVLPEFRKYIFFPPCVLVIPNSRAIIDTSRAAHGTHWMDCYTHTDDVDS